MNEGVEGGREVASFDVELIHPCVLLSSMLMRLAKTAFKRRGTPGLHLFSSTLDSLVLL